MPSLIKCRKKRFSLSKPNLITVALALAGLFEILSFTSCKDTCHQLKGSVAGIDLVFVGIGFMSLLLLTSLSNLTFPRLLLLAAAMGGEIFLVGYQVAISTYCIYCLIFAAIVATMFALNFECTRIRPVLACIAAGFFFLLLFFREKHIAYTW